MDHDLWNTAVWIIVWGGIGGVVLFALAWFVDWFSKLPENRSEDDQF